MTVFDKLHELKDALQGDSGDDKKEDQKEGWSDKLRDALGDSEAKKKREEEENRLRIEKEREEAKAKVEAERSWTGKIHDHIDGGKHKKELEEAEFQRLETQAQIEKKKEEGLHGHIGSALGEFKDKVDQLTHEPREKADKKEEVEQEGLHEKIKELWNKAPKDEKVTQDEHHHVWKQTKEEEKSAGWRDQLRGLTGQTQKEEKKKVERGWLKEKFNEMAGGGEASEASEDKLDKTLDFIQEHILHQGDQSNESALEQLKDEQISDAIRMAYKQVTGKEIPVKDK
ncbi:hypothetical protein QCA50_014243 [Cerrena zonata]|uniref:Uncharacterized protein n=1 Tax=Cerrena zonata TaxID=2478898 RepID=A0AAW0FZX5_9APHY